METVFTRSHNFVSLTTSALLALCREVTMTADVNAAFVTAGVAPFGVVVNALFTVRSFKKQKDLEKFKTEMQTDAFRNNALMAYQFEARKRLYSECEPVFFQLSEASELALDYCKKLARRKFCQGLIPQRDNRDKNNGFWMMSRSSELISLLHAMLSPLAFYCILRGKMTSVDCSLDQSISFRYSVVRQLFLSFQADSEIAELAPVIDYDPIVTDWRRRRLEMPVKYWWQGATPGRLDKAVRMLIASDGDVRRVITFGEFEDLYTNAYNGADRDKQKTIGVVANALYGFTPFDRPIFWRVILVQAHLHRILSRPIPADLAAILRSPTKLRSYLQMPDSRSFAWTEIGGWDSQDKADDPAEQVALDYLIRHLLVRDNQPNVAV